MSTPVVQAEIERLIDDNTLETVIEAIAEVCALKAEHIRMNWQDTTTAAAWDQLAKKTDNLSIFAHRYRL